MEKILKAFLYISFFLVIYICTGSDISKGFLQIILFHLSTLTGAMLVFGFHLLEKQDTLFTVTTQKSLKTNKRRAYIGFAPVIGASLVVLQYMTLTDVTGGTNHLFSEGIIDSKYWFILTSSFFVGSVLILAKSRKKLIEEEYNWILGREKERRNEKEEILNWIKYYFSLSKDKYYPKELLKMKSEIELFDRNIFDRQKYYNLEHVKKVFNTEDEDIVFSGFHFVAAAVYLADKYKLENLKDVYKI